MILYGWWKNDNIRRKVDTSTEYMTEYEKWAVSGVKEPKNLLKNLKVKQNNKQNGFVEKMRNRF